MTRAVSPEYLLLFKPVSTPPIQLLNWIVLWEQSDKSNNKIAFKQSFYITKNKSVLIFIDYCKAKLLPPHIKLPHLGLEMCNLFLLDFPYFFICYKCNILSNQRNLHFPSLYMAMVKLLGISVKDNFSLYHLMIAARFLWKRNCE